MARVSIYTPVTDEDIDYVLGFQHDPLLAKFVQQIEHSGEVYPAWGEPGELVTDEDRPPASSPRTWQAELLGHACGIGAQHLRDPPRASSRCASRSPRATASASRR
jgi:hypothetical protein